MHDSEVESPQDPPTVSVRRRVLALAVIYAVPLVLLGVVVATVLGRDSGEPPQPGADGEDAPVTAAPYRLERRLHLPGDCLRWDQDAGAGATEDLATVPCSDPHLVEVTGHAVIDGGPEDVPAQDELDRLSDAACERVDATHLGAPLDPGGRYYRAGIQPSPEGWAAGDREVWCALGARDGTEQGTPGRHRPFTGKVSATEQFWRYDRGQCLTTGRRATVPCTGAHTVEITGRTTLPDLPTVPLPDDLNGWNALVGDTCRAQATAYLTREPAAPLAPGWLPIEPASWRAGMRDVHCLVGEVGADGSWATVSRPARSTDT